MPIAVERTHTSVADVDPERLAYEEAMQQDARPRQGPPGSLSAVDVSIGAIGLVVWFGLFSGGILIGTEPHRRVLASPADAVSLFNSWFMVCAFWTVTNLGVLSCIAALLGALGRRARFTSPTDLPDPGTAVDRAPQDGIATFYLSAIMRGFGIYALVLAGLLVLATESLVSPTQEAYMRLAPTISLVSFYAGFDPSMFAGLLNRVNSFLQTNNQGIS